MLTLEELLERDLDYIVASLSKELPELSGKRLLITGGGGFLGYYLVQAALHWNRTSSGDPIDVTVYDNYIRGVPAWLETLSSAPHLTCQKVDMIEPLPDDMPEFDYIVHAAGIASPPFYRRDPLAVIDSNINGLRNLLEHAHGRAASNPISGMLFYSSSEIYGDPSPDAIPTPEGYRGLVSCTGPRACYDESKRFGETLCVIFADKFGIPVKVARPFNNYGPGLKITDRRVLPDFARDIFAGRDIALLSDGSPTRTFCYSADAVIGYYKVLVRGRPGEPYNVGIDRPEISIGDVAEQLVGIASRLFGYEGKVVRQAAEESDYLVDNPNRRCPDIAKARTELGFAPSIGIDDGLERSLIWYHYNREGTEA